MLKKTISYEDYNGTPRKEDFYFNLSKAEIATIEANSPGGFEAMIECLIDEQDQAAIIKIIKDIILNSYGEKSVDGKRFVKTQELRDGFEQTAAFSELFIELCSDEDATSAFVNGIIPASLSKQLAATDATA